MTSVVAAPGPIIRARDLAVEFERRGGRRRGDPLRAVDEVSLDIGKGETLCIVGESGSGKTTLVRAIGGLVPLTSGSVQFDGAEMVKLGRAARRQLRRRIQYVFQDPYESLSPRRNVFDVVSEPLRVHRLARSRQDLAKRVAEVLTQCGFEPATEYFGRYPHELSGGQRQRLLIAAAVVIRPDLLIADEPVSMLDVSVRAEILGVLKDLQASYKLSMIFVTHDLAIAWSIGDAIAVMYQGLLVEYGTAEEIIRSPRHPYTQALLQALPDSEGAMGLRELSIRGDGLDSDRVSSGCRFEPRCPYAQAICTQQRPPNVGLGTDHQSACLRAEEISLKGVSAGAASEARGDPGD
jgi:oligopeptide/dipeptide ABC transporter ATP-binding protein